MGHSTSSGRSATTAQQSSQSQAPAAPRRSQYSEEYYYNHWDEFLRPSNDSDNFIDMEKELSRAMRIYEGGPFRESDINAIRKVEAARVAERARAMVLRQKAVWQGIQNGTSSFGYTTQLQEIQARGRFLKRYEFNALQLRDFKRKYGV